MSVDQESDRVVQRGMATLVAGEDTESDEEINTDQLTEGSLGYVSGVGLSSLQTGQHKAGIVAGEESETDEEDESTASLEQTDSGARVQPTSSKASSVSPRGSPGRSSLDSTASAPPSLLHKRLRESNVSLRRNIVERILRIYHLTCRNLTVVNDNLSRAQGTIEKVNAHLKRSDNELAQLNTTLNKISMEAHSFVPTITTPPRQDTTPPKPPSQSTHPLFVPSLLSTSYINYWAAGVRKD